MTDWPAASAVQLLGDVALRSSLVLALGAAAAAVPGRFSAAARHLAWAITVTAALLLPLISVVLPAWRVLPVILDPTAPPVVAVLARAEPSHVTAGPQSGGVVVSVPPSGSGDVAAATMSTAASDHASTSRARTASVSRGSIAELMLLGWFAGLLLTLLAVALGFVRVRAITRRARRITAGPVLEQIARIAKELDVGAVLALEGGPGAMPMTWGIVQPKLLLPSVAHAWPGAKLHAVVTHELAHVRRRDALWQLIADVTCCLYWFNPLAWYAARRMRIEREHACDDVVLNAGSRASDYASELLDIARSLRSARATSLAAIALAQPRQLEGRLLAVLDASRDRGGVRRAWPAWLAAALIVVPLATVAPRVTAASTIPILGKDDALASSARQAEPPARRSARPGQPPAAASVARIPALTLAPMSQLREDCAEKGSRSFSSNSNGTVQTLKWEVGGCKGTLHLRGKVRLRGDLSGIESMSPGSDFRLWLNDGRSIRVVTARPSGNTIEYAYTVGGDPRPWNPEGRAWFATALAYVVRHTGFAADERVDYLLRHQGVSGVLAEVERMSSDYVQRLYLDKVLARTELNGKALETVIATATRTIESDYEMAELLIAVSNRYDFDDAARRAFIGATRTLQSDYEHRRAVSAVINKTDLSANDVVAILTSSQTIKSDYEKAELLLRLAGRYELDARMRTIYLASANNMNSDYEKGRVYQRLVRQGALSPVDAALVLEGAATISSDYERAEVLRLVPSSALSDAGTQQAYLRAITGMRSDYEARRSLMPLVEAKNLTPAALDVVLSAALDIESDYERAELLLAVLARHPLTPAQRKRVIDASGDWRSEYERDRVSSALLRQSAN